jgi:hypothetical protein
MLRHQADKYETCATSSIAHEGAGDRQDLLLAAGQEAAFAVAQPLEHGKQLEYRIDGPASGSRGSALRALWRAHPGRCLPDLNQVPVRVSDVRADFGAVLLGISEELSAAR